MKILAWILAVSALGCGLTVLSIWLNHRRRRHGGSGPNAEEFDRVNKDAKRNQDATQYSLASNRDADAKEHEGIRHNVTSNQDEMIPRIASIERASTWMKGRLDRFFRPNDTQPPEDGRKK